MWSKCDTNVIQIYNMISTSYMSGITVVGRSGSAPPMILSCNSYVITVMFMVRQLNLLTFQYSSNCRSTAQCLEFANFSVNIVSNSAAQQHRDEIIESNSNGIKWPKPQREREEMWITSRLLQLLSLALRLPWRQECGDTTLPVFQRRERVLSPWEYYWHFSCLDSYENFI